MSNDTQTQTLWVVIDVGCYECGVSSEPVGIYTSEIDAYTAAAQRDAATNGWRNDGQTNAEVFEMQAPN